MLVMFYSDNKSSRVGGACAFVVLYLSISVRMEYLVQQGPVFLRISLLGSQFFKTYSNTLYNARVIKYDYIWKLECALQSCWTGLEYQYVHIYFQDHTTYKFHIIHPSLQLGHIFKNSQMSREQSANDSTGTNPQKPCTFFHNQSLMVQGCFQGWIDHSRNYPPRKRTR